MGGASVRTSFPWSGSLTSFLQQTRPVLWIQGRALGPDAMNAPDLVLQQLSQFCSFIYGSSLEDASRTPCKMYLVGGNHEASMPLSRMIGPN